MMNGHWNSSSSVELHDAGDSARAAASKLTRVLVSSREPDREVDVGARIVDAPVAAVAAAAAKRDAAEMEERRRNPAASLSARTG